MSNRFQALLVLALLCGGTACADQPAVEDRAVRLNLANTGAAALHCRLMFGHWVEQDLGLIASGGSVGLAISQAAGDGALYILRADGQRRMMIETILCGRDGDWMATYGQVDFAPARSAKPARIEASCALPERGGRVACLPLRLEN
jgi:hypothetical protein